MIILGISGFEGIGSSQDQHVYSMRADSIDALCTFTDRRVPLQFFPLHLIGHDSSAALIVDGEIVAAAAEERFSRVKHGFNLAGQTVLPRKAVAYCLGQARIAWNKIDYIAHYCHFTEESVQRRLEKVSQNLDPHLKPVLAREYWAAYRNRLSRDVLLQQLEEMSGGSISGDRLITVRHHLAHAAGAFYNSDYREALILNIDGYGEEESSLWCIGQGQDIQPLGSIELPTSLGLLYQVVTAYLGFRAFGDEYKVMGLSAYGDPTVYQAMFDGLIEHGADGSYRIDGLSRPDLAEVLKEYFPGVPQDSEFSRRKADIAAALQKTLEKVLLSQLSSLRREHGIKNLCVSGGVGLNACANGAILRSGLFDSLFFQPAAGDDGASLGAACFVWHSRKPDGKRRPLHHVFLGPSYDSALIENVLRQCSKIEWKKEPKIEEITAGFLDQGKIVGWFQGKMEMGPRSLGARSILADPRRVALRDRINALIKGREPFRPFAPSILEEEASKYFAVPKDTRSAFMLMTFETREDKKALIPAVVHVDGSARIQTVSHKENPKFHVLLRRFYERTGIPLLLNTSFNRAGEPIVNSPEDALACFLACGIDVLVIEDYLVLPKKGYP